MMVGRKHFGGVMRCRTARFGACSMLFLAAALCAEAETPGDPAATELPDLELPAPEVFLEAPEGPSTDALDLPGPEAFLVDIPEPAPSRRPAEQTLPPDERVRALVREGGIEVRAGNHEAAVRTFRRAKELAPREKSVRFGLGTALIAVGQYAEAEALLKELEDEYPEDYFILNNLAWLYATARDIRVRDGERSLRYVRRALLLAPTDHYVWSTLAEAHYVSAQYARAVRAAEQAVHLAREQEADETAQRDYRRLLEKSRQAAQAFDILD